MIVLSSTIGPWQEEPPIAFLPSLTPHHAVELLRKRLNDFDRIIALHRRDPEVGKWITTTAAVLDGAFGMPNGGHHEMTNQFTYTGGVTYSRASDQFYEQEHRRDMLKRKAVVESCIEQLEMLAPPAAQVAVGRYQFHVEIGRVSSDLFRDGHYVQAALAAYIRVINEVKLRSGLNHLEGDDLMNQAFAARVNRFETLPRWNLLSSVLWGFVDPDLLWDGE